MNLTKYGTLVSHKLRKENQISDRILHGNKFVKYHDLTHVYHY